MSTMVIKSERDGGGAGVDSGPVGPVKRILIVEDDSLLALVLSTALTSYTGRAYQVEISLLGAEALAKLRAAPVDLVVVDLRMPGMNGLEFIQRARKIDPGMRAMLITAFGSCDVEDAAADLSAVYLPKPFSLHTFVAVVRQILAHSAADMSRRIAKVSLILEAAHS